MSTTFCPHCHQPIAETRAGIRLPWRKVQIFDVIRRSGRYGIRVEYINQLCFDGVANAVTIRNHIKQINQRGVSILMVEQKARQCLAMSDHAYVLDMGQNRMHGSGQELLNDREVIELYLGSRGRLGAAVVRLREQYQPIPSEVT